MVASTFPGIRLWQFLCPACGHGAYEWAARCPKCAAYGFRRITATDLPPPELELDPEPPTARDELANVTSVAARFDEIEDVEYQRMSSGLEPFDTVLGGGFVPGGLFAIGGPPGCGKSSLLMQALEGTGEKVLFASGEQTIGEVKTNGKRIGVEGRHITVVHEPTISGVLAHTRVIKPAILAIDSIQTMLDQRLNGKPGSPTQVTECTRQLMTFAKQSGMAIILICHVTNDGTMAGPQTLKHLVDVVLSLDIAPGNDQIRILGALGKNRYGSSATRGRFAMTDHGLEPIAASGEQDDSFQLDSLRDDVVAAAIAAVSCDFEDMSLLIDTVRDYEIVRKRRHRAPF